MITAEVRPLVTRESFITEAIFLASAGSVTLAAATEGDTGAAPVIISPAAKAATSVSGGDDRHDRRASGEHRAQMGK